MSFYLMHCLSGFLAFPIPCRVKLSGREGDSKHQQHDVWVYLIGVTIEMKATGSTFLWYCLLRCTRWF